MLTLSVQLLNLEIHKCNDDDKIQAPVRTALNNALKVLRDPELPSLFYRNAELEIYAALNGLIHACTMKVSEYSRLPRAFEFKEAIEPSFAEIWNDGEGA